MSRDSALLKISFWCFCPRTGEKRFGYLDWRGEETMFVNAALVKGSDLKSDIEAVMAVENAELDVIIHVDWLGPWSSNSRLTRINYAYCQIDLSKYAMERDHRELPMLEFHTLESMKERMGLPGSVIKSFQVLGEIMFLETHPPKI